MPDSNKKSVPEADSPTQGLTPRVPQMYPEFTERDALILIYLTGGGYDEWLHPEQKEAISRLIRSSSDGLARADAAERALREIAAHDCTGIGSPPSCACRTCIARRALPTSTPTKQEKENDFRKSGALILKRLSEKDG